MKQRKTIAKDFLERRHYTLLEKNYGPFAFVTRAESGQLNFVSLLWKEQATKKQREKAARKWLKKNGIDNAIVRISDINVRIFSEDRAFINMYGYKLQGGNKK